jgi:hypothetical protein
MRWLLALPFLLGVAAGAEENAARFARADRQAAGRFFSLALRAEKLEQGATARTLFLRVLELDPHHTTARRRLGYRRTKGGWTRDSAAAAAADRLANTDPATVLQLREERRKLERRRAAEVLRLAAKYATPAEARPRIEALLAHAPRFEDAHEALGHERIGELWVRPELAAYVRAMPGRVAAWEACRKPGDAYATKETLYFPGLEERKPVLRVEQRLVASGYTRGNTLYLARRTQCAHDLMRRMLGEDVDRWDGSPIYFLSPAQYGAFIRHRHKDAETRRRRLNFLTYKGGDCYALCNRGFKYVLDLYAHAAGFWTMQRLVSPKKPDGGRDWDKYPWIKEGFALLLTLEIFDTAHTWFISSGESSGKAQPTLPLPETRSRAACLAYVRDQLYDGTLPPLREILGNSLNNLDRFRALVAWTYVRFLALYDPEAFRRLPAALRAQTEGAQVARAERALAIAYATDARELERLWRISLLELTD